MSLHQYFTAVRKEYPLLKDGKFVYFDSAATALVPLCVIEKVKDFQIFQKSNTHRSGHKLAQKATSAFESARETLAKFIGCKKEEVIWTRGTSESLNLIALLLIENGFQGKKVTISEMEHHSNIIPWFFAKEKKKLSLHVLKKEDLKKEVLKLSSTDIISLFHVSNVLGEERPLETWFSIFPQAFKIVDAAQSAPHHLLNWQKWDCDALAFSGHKLGSLEGIGVLALKKKYQEQWKPVFGGGGMLHAFSFEKGIQLAPPPLRFEPGTPPASAIISLKEALIFQEALGWDSIHSYLIQLKKALLSILKRIPDLHIISDETSPVPIVTFYLEGIHSQDIGTLLSEQGFCLRVGGHCAEPLAQSLHIPFRSSLRVSLSFYNSFDELERFEIALKKSLKILKG